MQQLLINKILNPFNGNLIAGTGGLVVGAGAGWFFSNWRASNEKKALLLQLKYLPKETAVLLNENFSTILKNTVKQLNLLDENCKLPLKLGDQIQTEFTQCCTIQPHPEKDEYWTLEKLHINTKTGNTGLSSSADIEAMIGEYFDSYFDHREAINSENRAAAVMLVTMLRNTSILLIQLMKGLAKIPGKENEERLEKCKAIVHDFWSNVTSNKILMENLNQNIFQKVIGVFSSQETQRKNLATHIENHYLPLINQLKVEQRDLSIQEMSLYSFQHLQALSQYFMEVVARLLDKDAALEMTEITTYKLARGILHADTASKTKGQKNFYELGICSLLKPIAMICEGLRSMGRQEDALSFIVYQKLLNEQHIEKLLWKQSNQFVNIHPENQKLITQDIRDITKLLLICQALEKEFMYSATQNGFQGMLENGEYHAKRTILHIFFQEAMRRIKSFFTKHSDIERMLNNMHDKEFLKKAEIFTESFDEKYIQGSTLSIEETDLLTQKKCIENTAFSSRTRNMQYQRAQMEYVFQALFDIGKEIPRIPSQQKEHYYFDSKAMKIYLFNVCNLLSEFHLTGAFQKSKTSENTLDTALYSALELTHTQMETITYLMDELNSHCLFTAQYSTQDISLSLDAKLVTYTLSFKDNSAPLHKEIFESIQNAPFQLLRFSNTPSKSIFPELVTQWITKDYKLHCEPLTQCNIIQLITYYEKLHKDYLLLQTISTKIQDHAPLQHYLEELHKILQIIEALIAHVQLQEEYNKRLASNNTLLKSENKHQREYINTLTQNVEKLEHVAQQSTETTQNLKILSEKNTILVEEKQNQNQAMYQFLLQELSTSIEEIEEMRQVITQRIQNIKHHATENTNIVQDLKYLEEDVETRTKKLITRIKKYTEIFKSANEEIQKTFKLLKERFTEEQNLISQLKSQLDKVMSELNKQKVELAFFQQKTGSMMIVSSFDDLFKELETHYTPRLSFFHSYRPVKTDNILGFIRMLLNSRQFLKEDIGRYKSIEAFQTMIEQKLSKSRIINAYRGISNKSESLSLCKKIIKAFVDNSLIQKLQSNEIAYHGAYITLDEKETLSYQNIAINCPVQPLRN